VRPFVLIIIDNYDSFTYNIVQYCGELGFNFDVYLNDSLTIGDLEKKNPEKIIISPGPGGPDKAGVAVDVIKAFAGRVPILGVCLGHQCLAVAFGCKVVQSKKVMHGKTSMITHHRRGLFENISNPFEATRYHSLIVERETLSDCFEIMAWTEDLEVMSIRHKKYLLWGVQFHPESILTKEGKTIFKNFLSFKNSPSKKIMGTK